MSFTDIRTRTILVVGAVQVIILTLLLILFKKMSA